VLEAMIKTVAAFMKKNRRVVSRGVHPKKEEIDDNI